MYARTENEYQVFLLAGTLQSVLLKRKAFFWGEVVFPVVGTFHGSVSESERLFDSSVLCLTNTGR